MTAQAVAIILAKFRDAINYMGMLLDLRHKSKRPYHRDELVIIVEHVTDLVLAHDVRRVEAEGAAAAAAVVAACAPQHEISNDLLPETGRALERLLQKIMLSCPNEPEMWQVCAGFYSRLRRHR